MARIVWDAEHGWHDNGPECRVINERGRLVIEPLPESAVAGVSEIPEDKQNDTNY